jgi:hypothetical protein
MGLVQRIGNLRDGLIVLGTGVYLLGYLSWAHYAVTYELGLIPALDAQYFTASIVPALIILSLYLSARGLIALSRWSTGALSGRQRRAGVVLGYIGGAVIALSLITRLLLPEEQAAWRDYLVYAGAVLVYAAAFLSRVPGEAILQRVGIVALWGFTILGSLWLTLAYLVRWFPSLPQELGGPSPRCVQLDIAPTRLSGATRHLLLSDTQPVDVTEVQRSRNVYLIFDGREFVLLKRQAGALNSENPVYRVGKMAIEGIVPCSPSA